ncbi:MAG: tyrosinase family protein [Actinobacteria bacterium]|nr:tyrosinase family protein [Actinomycetota bacterium]
MRVRKDVTQLTEQEKRDFVDAILKLKHRPSPWNPKLSYYDQFVWWHTNAFDCQIDAAHMWPSFLPWHRKLLMLFENALRKVSGKPITIPYWDWTDPNATAAVFSPDFFGGGGDPKHGYAVTTGPLRKGKWRFNVLGPKLNDPYQRRYLVRDLGSSIATTLPTAEQVNEALARPRYDYPPYDIKANIKYSFRNFLEGWRHAKGMKCIKGTTVPLVTLQDPQQMHNRVHLWVGGAWDLKRKKPRAGSMVLNASPNDPVFWLHHANIDRIWSEWERIHGEVYEPRSGLPNGKNLNDTMWPYRTIGIETTIAQLLDIRKLGYRYSAP